jgi:hypothetical protein
LGVEFEGRGRKANGRLKMLLTKPRITPRIG